jgi:hypothetical protein
MFSMVYDGAQCFIFAPQIAPFLELLRPTTKKMEKGGLMVL